MLGNFKITSPNICMREASHWYQIEAEMNSPVLLLTIWYKHHDCHNILSTYQISHSLEYSTHGFHISGRIFFKAAISYPYLCYNFLDLFFHLNGCSVIWLSCYKYSTDITHRNLTLHMWYSSLDFGFIYHHNSWWMSLWKFKSSVSR